MTATVDRRHRLLAVEGYVRLVGRSDMTGGERIALLKDLLARPFDDADKKPAIAALADIREPGSLHLLSLYLDNAALGEAASAALLEMASLQAPDEPWLSRHEAVSVLRRVEARPATPAEKERTAAIIRDRLRQGGFVPLFDGRGLEGWKGPVGDPPARAKMSPAELAAAQAAADEKMRAHWRVVDGILVFDGQGESLCTAADYGDFELLVDWKIESGGDSGLYLRGSPQVQIWDAGANPVGSGGLYNNQKGKSIPLEKADHPVGEWNSFRVIMIGERVSVYLNDRLVVDNTVLENYWERDTPIYPAGQIELQAHGNPLYFRNIFIREIPGDGAAPQLTEAEAAEGFVPLFNGRGLDGWTGDTKGYAAENGKIVIRPELASGNLYTAGEFAEFVLRFEFKLTPGANNGLAVRAPLEGDAAYAGLELQILDDGSPLYWGLEPRQFHGAVYGVVPARRGSLRPPGDWNSQEVSVQGRRVKVVLNGATIVDADLDEAAARGTLNGRDHPGLKRKSGHIGFLGHGSLVEFRNIRLKKIFAGSGSGLRCRRQCGVRDSPDRRLSRRVHPLGLVRAHAPRLSRRRRALDVRALQPGRDRRGRNRRRRVLRVSRRPKALFRALQGACRKARVRGQAGPPRAQPGRFDDPGLGRGERRQSRGFRRHLSGLRYRQLPGSGDCERGLSSDGRRAVPQPGRTQPDRPPRAAGPGRCPRVRHPRRRRYARSPGQEFRRNEEAL